MPKIAGYELHTLETGRFGLDGGAMFGIVPKPLWEKKIPADARNRIPLAMRCLLMIGHGRVVLIDNGLGDKYSAKFADLFAVDHTQTNLDQALRAHDLAPADITDVILTHLHFDHAGGSTRRAGERLVPTFPNATFHIQKRHWDWAQQPNARERNSFLKENFEPLAAAGQINGLATEGTLWPGVELMEVNGHTEAQQMVKISDPDATLVFVADLIPTHAHVPQPWIMGYDLSPLKTLDEKTSFLETAYQHGWQIFYEHDPAVEISGLVQTDRGIRPAHPRRLVDF